MITIRCTECKHSYKTQACWIKRRKHGFCSKDCAGKWRASHIWGKNHPQYKIPELIECPVCSKKFYPHNKKSRYCSPRCRGKTYSAENHYKYNKVPTYQDVHWWIRYYYGNANKCENYYCRKKSSIFEWALKHNKKYERKRKNFWMLCKGCHIIYDRHPLPISKNPIT